MKAIVKHDEAEHAEWEAGHHLSPAPVCVCCGEPIVQASQGPLQDILLTRLCSRCYISGGSWVGADELGETLRKRRRA